ncbi:MAG TPA: DUF4156 domain-containing protein [Polyangiaceae bacterium]
MKSLPLFAFPLLLLACAGQIPQHVELQPQAEAVEFAYEAPSSEAYKEVGHVKGEAAGKDADVALEQAKNDLRNKAAALGAALVTIDENVGTLVPLTDETKVTLSGRAYKPAD